MAGQPTPPPQRNPPPRNKVLIRPSQGKPRVNKFFSLFSLNGLLDAKYGDSRIGKFVILVRFLWGFFFMA